MLSIKFNKNIESYPKEYRISNDPIKGIVLKSNVICKKGELFTTFKGIYNKKITQHSLFDYSKQLHLFSIQSGEISKTFLYHSEITDSCRFFTIMNVNANEIF